MWDDRGDGYDMMNGGGVAMGFGVLVLVLLGLALLAVVANLYLHVSPRHGTPGAPTASGPVAPAETEARRVLDRRLALGEVSTEDYSAIRAALDA